jgi:succinate dehydrogenase / fumarate reductase cytochrome b subunit
MRRTGQFHRSSVGTKVIMALSGIALFGFVLVHMLGNLKIYQGAAKFDAYAKFLREAGSPLLAPGQALWLLRGLLIVAVLLHIRAAFVLSRQSLAARPVRYRRLEPLSFSYASHTMRWGGVTILAFVIYHLLHLTWGVAHADFDPTSPYRNVVAGFRHWAVAAVYLLAMAPLGLHLYHGLWSATQTLGAESPRIVRWRRAVAAALTAVIVAGNVSVPLAVLSGIVD